MPLLDMLRPKLLNLQRTQVRDDCLGNSRYSPLVFGDTLGAPVEKRLQICGEASFGLGQSTWVPASTAPSTCQLALGVFIGAAHGNVALAAVCRWPAW